jgi:hypothetical protein
MKYAFVLLILCASCTFKKSPTNSSGAAPSSSPSVIATASRPENRALEIRGHEKSDVDKEFEKISRWFEQMDAVLREALWVVKKERPPLGKSIFGKMQRALLVEMKQRLSNKSLFRCDVYTMSLRTNGSPSRKGDGPTGVPQTAEVFHRCNSRESFAKFGEWRHLKPDELEIDFQASNLSEVLGIATGIFNPKIHCKLKSNDAGLIQNFSCENLMMDYNPAKNQVLKFKRFEFSKSGQQILHLQADVLENLEAVRKIEADVPIDGAILVTETVLKAPPQATPVPTPAPTIPPPQTQAGGDAGTPENPSGREGGGRATIQRAPVPADQLGTRGAPVIPGMEPGEYHEGGPLPGEAEAPPSPVAPLMPSPNTPPAEPIDPNAPPSANPGTNPAGPPTESPVAPRGGPLPPGVEPMPEMGTQR